MKPLFGASGYLFSSLVDHTVPEDLAAVKGPIAVLPSAATLIAQATPST